jgi:CAAX prenyl protease-like protein
MPTRRKIIAYLAPFLVFAVFLALNEGLHKIDNSIWLSHAEFWIYPLQTIVCGALVIFFRREYDLETPRGIPVGVAVAIFTFALWISPQAFLGQPPRVEGFNPDFFAANPVIYSSTIAFRFLRLVVVVPFVEEIFWRGFLLRYFVDADFTRVRIGAFSWFSFLAVATLFMLSHASPDWPAAFVTGALYNLVAIRTRSLTACVVTHAVTNLLLGLWIMQTRQWGFW